MVSGVGTWENTICYLTWPTYHTVILAVTIATKQNGNIDTKYNNIINMNSSSNSSCWCYWGISGTTNKDNILATTTAQKATTFSMCGYKNSNKSDMVVDSDSNAKKSCLEKLSKKGPASINTHDMVYTHKNPMWPEWKRFFFPQQNTLYHLCLFQNHLSSFLVCTAYIRFRFPSSQRLKEVIHEYFFYRPLSTKGNRL